MKLADMLIETEVDQQPTGATLFFGCEFVYSGNFSGGGIKPGEITVSVALPSPEASKDFVTKCRTPTIKRFFKDYMENGFETFAEAIVDNSSAAEDFGAMIKKLTINGEMIMSSAQTPAHAPQTEAMRLSNNRWRYKFFFQTLEQFVKEFSHGSGKAIVDKHFGSEEDMLDTFTL